MDAVFAIIAAIVFGLAFLLDIAGASWDVSLIALGLFFIALHLALGVGVPWRRGP